MEKVESFVVVTIEELITDESRRAFVQEFASGCEGVETFRIRAADGKGWVFFADRELLVRFTKLDISVQGEFLGAVRTAMERENVKEVRLEVQLGPTTRRVVRVIVSDLTSSFLYIVSV